MGTWYPVPSTLGVTSHIMLDTRRASTSTGSGVSAAIETDVSGETARGPLVSVGTGANTVKG